MLLLVGRAAGCVSVLIGAVRVEVALALVPATFALDDDDGCHPVAVRINPKMIHAAAITETAMRVLRSMCRFRLGAWGLVSMETVYSMRRQRVWFL